MLFQSQSSLIEIPPVAEADSYSLTEEQETYRNAFEFWASFAIIPEEVIRKREEAIMRNSFFSGEMSYECFLAEESSNLSPPHNSDDFIVTPPTTPSPDTENHNDIKRADTPSTWFA